MDSRSIASSLRLPFHPPLLFPCPFKSILVQRITFWNYLLQPPVHIFENGLFAHFPPDKHSQTRHVHHWLIPLELFVRVSKTSSAQLTCPVVTRALSLKASTMLRGFYLCCLRRRCQAGSYLLPSLALATIAGLRDQRLGSFHHLSLYGDPRRKNKNKQDGEARSKQAVTVKHKEKQLFQQFKINNGAL